jgi:hypothetical protein
MSLTVVKPGMGEAQLKRSLVARLFCSQIFFKIFFGVTGQTTASRGSLLQQEKTRENWVLKDF